MLDFDEIPEAQSCILIGRPTCKLSVMRCQTERSGVLISS